MLRLPNITRGEDYKSKLEHRGWQIIAYAEDIPISVFTLVEQEGKIVVANVAREDVAKGFDRALKQLEGNDVASFPEGFYTFIGDKLDNIAFASPQGLSHNEYETKTFEEFNRAMNQTINYYNSFEDVFEIPFGASVVVDYLYNDSLCQNLL